MLVTGVVSADVFTVIDAVPAGGLVTLAAVTETVVLAPMMGSGCVPVNAGMVRVTVEPPPVRVDTVPDRPWADTV